jgi:ABC-type multidrug transport system ATPase subunit
VTYDFKIEKGQSILISGENGAGKSTLIRLILGFIKPDEGEIKRKKIKMSYLPEHILLPPFIKVKAYIEGFAKIKKADIDWEVIESFELPLNKSIYELSKGNIQKLGIILTMLGSSDLLIFDEPLSGLDDHMKCLFIDHLKYLKSSGKSFIISSHEPNRFLPIIDEHIRL